MTWINKSDIIPTIPESDLVELYKNDNVPDGSFVNAQFLRKYTNGLWILCIRSDSTTFKIVLQEHQARSMIAGESGHYFDCAVINHTKDY